MLSQYNSVSKHHCKSASHNQLNYGNMGYGNIAHQHYANSMHQRNYNIPKSHCQGCSKQAIPRHHPAERLHHHSRINDTARAIQKANFESSLHPHGDPMPEDWIDSWDERPECPRPKWTYQKNLSKQPAVKNQHGEYSGTDLIQARGDDVLKTSYTQLNNFHANIRPQTWQLNSAKDFKDTLIVTNATSDYETGDSNSDSSSVKSGSSGEWSPVKFLGALW